MFHLNLIDGRKYLGFQKQHILNINHGKYKTQIKLQFYHGRYCIKIGCHGDDLNNKLPSHGRSQQKP